MLYKSKDSVLAPLLLLGRILPHVHAGTSAAMANQTSSVLQINSPSTLKKPGGYVHREALFGNIPYGKPLRYNLYYADSDLCDPHVDTSAGYPEREKDGSGEMLPWPPPFILLVDRDKCTFAEKVRNAQRVGAAAVIVADSTCICSEDNCVPGAADCQEVAPTMAGDVTSYDVTIPSVLMLKSDADTIKKTLRANELVEAEMLWPLPKAYDSVQVEFWSTPADLGSQDFLLRFKDVLVALGDHVNFSPHMIVYNTGSTSSSYGNYRDSVSNYHYSTGLDASQNGITDPVVVKESLRQLCIWKHYGLNDGIGVKWWNYVKYFISNCSSKPNLFSDANCIEDAYQVSDIDGNIIDRCIEKSGGLVTGGSNALLEQEITLREHRWGEEKVSVHTPFVNGVPVRGRSSLSNVFNAICAGYEKGEGPDICTQCSGCNSDMHSCVILEQCKSRVDNMLFPETIAGASFSSQSTARDSDENSGWGFWAGFMLCLVLVCATGCFFLYLRQNKDSTPAGAGDEKGKNHSGRAYEELELA